MAFRRGWWGPLLLSLGSATAQAKNFYFDLWDERIEANSNTALIAGAAIRTQDRDSRIIGKVNLNPELCGRGPDGNLYYQSCQGLFREQTFAAERLVSAPGIASLNFDQGNLNYDKNDLTQAPVRLNQDLTLSWGNYGLFVKAFAFHDFINDDFTETHPNRITSGNIDRVGYVSTPGSELVRPSGVGPTVGVRSDSRECPADRNPVPGQPCGLVYGPGGLVHTGRGDRETLREIGSGVHLLDLNAYGTFELPGERQLLVKVGRQLINWGESTVQFFDSLNVINPPNLNNLFRIGGNGLDDFFLPINAISASSDIFEGAVLSAHYQLEWRPVVAPAPGGFYSIVDLGTSDAGDKFLTDGFGYLAEDPEQIATLLDNPLTGITNTTSYIERLPDREPDADGQYGVEFKYYAENFNDGTEFGLFAMNYHARAPLVSVYSVADSCAKTGAVPVTDAATFANACPDLPVFHAASSPNDPEGATSNAVPFDTLKVVLEYPEDIQLYGLSFNTTFGGAGGISVQGEAVYRPDEPLQVAIFDLGFAAFGPTLTNCHLPPGCAGSSQGNGIQPDGSVGTYGSSDFVLDAIETPGAFTDTFDAAVGAIPGSGRSFPSFIIPYRGGVVGANPGQSYIRGWEYFDTYAFNLGATYVEGSTDLTPGLLAADQVIWLFEIGSRWVPGLPPLDQLQLEAPGIQYHASAGADGSGADRSRQACSTNPACTFGVDGLRFNPHQQDLDLYPDEWSGGYSIVQLIRYESLVPGYSLQVQTIFKHDVYNTSPGLASNFVEGRIIWDTGFELRYKSQLSFNLGYQFFGGGGIANQLTDRDNARFFVKYSL